MLGVSGSGRVLKLCLYHASTGCGGRVDLGAHRTRRRVCAQRVDKLAQATSPTHTMEAVNAYLSGCDDGSLLGIKAVKGILRHLPSLVLPEGDTRLPAQLVRCHARLPSL